MKLPSQTATRSYHGECTLVIMAKAPKPGMVKTRLSQNLPVDVVADFYCCLLHDTIALARSLGSVKVAMMCPSTDVEELTVLAGDSVDVVAQEGLGLAAGLTSVFAYFAAGGQQRVVAFNSDSPHLSASVLKGAFEELSTHDIVIGPTHDGGYYLIGAKASHPTLFENDGMGTRNALDALLSRAGALQLSVSFTDPFYDIDVAEDLVRIAADLGKSPERAPRTAAWLKDWGQAIKPMPGARKP